MNGVTRLLAPDEGRDALRKLAGLLIGLGLFLTFVRRGTGGLGSTWSDWGLFATLLIAFAFLYGVGMLGALSTRPLRSWRRSTWCSGSWSRRGAAPVHRGGQRFAGRVPQHLLGVRRTAGLAVAAPLLTGLGYGLLLASLAVIVAWSALWDKILSNGIGAHFGVYRGLLLILAGLLLVAAGAVWRLDERDGAGRAREIVTGAAVSAVLAGSLSFPDVFGLANPFVSVSGPASSLLWEIVLLVVSLLAVGYGSRAGAAAPPMSAASGWPSSWSLPARI